jgi:hypothetical protein
MGCDAGLETPARLPPQRGDSVRSNASCRDRDLMPAILTHTCVGLGHTWSRLELEFRDVLGTREERSASGPHGEHGAVAGERVGLEEIVGA